MAGITRPSKSSTGLRETEGPAGVPLGGGALLGAREQERAERRREDRGGNDRSQPWKKDAARAPWCPETGAGSGQSALLRG